MERFVAIYAKTAKEGFRENRDNVAEKLSSLGRVIHGSNERLWIKSLKSHLGEATNQAETVEA
jgi:hypothetical protein